MKTKRRAANGSSQVTLVKLVLFTQLALDCDPSVDDGETRE